MDKYFSIQKLLPYQRNFIFVNGSRSIGKTYSTLKFLINRALKGEEFIYIVRTQDEKKKGVFALAFEKVLQNEFSETEFNFNNEVLTQTDTLGYCIALSEAGKIKKRSFPNVKYIIFDEYMLEKEQMWQYVNGWKEPNLLLSLYHTVDREKDTTVVILLGNNTNFYNPYHMHPAFNIPKINVGQIWKNENVLFFNADVSPLLNEARKNNKFLNMIDNTTYGEYAKNGVYVDENNSFIEEMRGNLTYNFTLVYMDNYFGVFSNLKEGIIYVSEKYDPSFKISYALTISDHRENTLLTKSKNITHLNWFVTNFKNGNVRYVNMIVKTKIEKGLLTLL